MNKIDFMSPENINEAVRMLKERGGRILAGGTDLMGVIREKILPDQINSVVSLQGIGELKGIKKEGDQISIGSMTTLSEVAENEEILSRYPLLAKAAKSVASPQIRNVATIGGNICQEPRCWYYRYQDDKFNCLRKGGGRCNAMVGRNIYHSIFGSAPTGKTPCTSGCPNSTDVPLYMEMIRDGKTKEAADILFSVNPIAGVTGRVCPHDCENQCNRGYFDENVNIREVERYLGDYILDNGAEYYIAGKGLGKKVSVIGAGPAGLTAAISLAKSGCEVTVYDENEDIGGMLHYGIPSYRLPKSILKKYHSLMENMGIVFHLNTRIGKDITFEKISTECDAVFVGIGAWKAQGAGVVGEESDNVMSGIEFLNRVAKKESIDLGGKVVVVGGGNTAMDAARTAKRMGAGQVTVVYRRSREEMPAENEEIAEAENEGVIFKNLVSPAEILARNSRAYSVKLQNMKLGLKDESGRRRPVPINDSYENIEADHVIIAIGQNVDSEGLDGLETEKSGVFKADESGVTGLKNIYSAGDCVSGAATAVEAIAGGRIAAENIASVLGLNEDDIAYEGHKLIAFHKGSIENSVRSSKSCSAEADRTLYDENESTFEEKDFLYESRRCFSCGCVASSPTDMGTAIVALNGIVVTDSREIPATEFFEAGITSSTVLMPGEIVKHIRLPGSGDPEYQKYIKYRTRETIDFPILSIAADLQVDDGRVSKACIVVGAAAPIPLHLENTENALIGQVMADMDTESVSQTAIADCIPLAENKYKINLLRVYLRRLLDEFKFKNADEKVS